MTWEWRVWILNPMIILWGWCMFSEPITGKIKVKPVYSRITIDFKKIENTAMLWLTWQKHNYCSHLWSISPVSNEIKLIPVLEDTMMTSSSQPHVIIPISSPASGTVRNNEPSLLSQTLTTPSCEPAQKKNPISWDLIYWLKKTIGGKSRIYIIRLKTNLNKKNGIVVV